MFVCQAVCCVEGRDSCFHCLVTEKLFSPNNRVLYNRKLLHFILSFLWDDDDDDDDIMTMIMMMMVMMMMMMALPMKAS